MTAASMPPEADAPRGHRGRSLLGIYPVPALHLVGAPTVTSPRMPFRWQPAVPPPQYGIDYAFLNGFRGEPVTWLPHQPITIRIAARHTAGQASAVAEVVTELAQLTGLPLNLGTPWPAGFDPRRVPDQEIHVGFPPAPREPGLAGFAGAALAAGGRHYTSGYAAVYHAATDSIPDPEAARQDRAALRHELAHAVGLGHAARPSLLMYYRALAEQDGYGRGDRHGLALLGQAQLTVNHPSPRHRRRSLLCVA